MNILIVLIYVILYVYYTNFISKYIQQRRLYKFFLYLNILFLTVLESLFYWVLGKEYSIFTQFYMRIVIVIIFGLIGGWLSKAYKFNRQHDIKPKE